MRKFPDFLFGAPEVFAIVGIRSNEQGVVEQPIDKSLRTGCGRVNSWTSGAIIEAKRRRLQVINQCSGWKRPKVKVYHVHGQKWDEPILDKLNMGLEWNVLLKSPKLG